MQVDLYNGSKMVVVVVVKLVYRVCTITNCVNSLFCCASNSE